MSTAAVRAAVALAYQKFLLDAKLRPELMTDSDRMIFEAAFVYGALWSQTERLKDVA